MRMELVASSIESADHPTPKPAGTIRRPLDCSCSDLSSSGSKSLSGSRSISLFRFRYPDFDSPNFHDDSCPFAVYPAFEEVLG